MIPKKIHYCWFGEQPIPKKDLECINSWIKFFPDYEIIQWNESNFNINICSYVKEAYDKKKWAFVSDFVRIYVLYEYGGIYFDTDVEVIKKFDDIIEKGPFMGVEQFQPSCMVNPGIGMAAIPKMKLFEEILNSYYNSEFIDENGIVSNYTIVSRVTDILLKHGLKSDDRIQFVFDITIYPKEYFCPLDYDTNILNITDSTYSIHWFKASWFDNKMKLRKNRCIKIRKLFGKNVGNIICNIYIKFSVWFEYIENGNTKVLLKRLSQKIKNK